VFHGAAAWNTSTWARSAPLLLLTEHVRALDSPRAAGDYSIGHDPRPSRVANRTDWSLVGAYREQPVAGSTERSVAFCARLPANEAGSFRTWVSRATYGQYVIDLVAATDRRTMVTVASSRRSFGPWQSGSLPH
jgi:hypothetical protein